MSERTVIDRVRLLNLFQRRVGVPAQAASWQQIAGFLGNPALSTGTTMTYQSHLRAWFTWLARSDLRLDDPMVHIDRVRAPRRLPRPVSDDQLQALLSEQMRPHVRVMVTLAAYMGLRAAEIARVHNRDVRGEQLHVTRKGGVETVLQIHPIVAAAAAGIPAVGWWLPSRPPPTRPMNPSSVSGALGRVMRRAKIEDGGGHRLRHWNGTTQLKTANLRVVQENLGHASIQTTVLYTHVDDAERRAAILALPVPLHVIRTPGRRPR